MPYIGKSTDGFGIRERFTYVVSAGATSISGADANGRTLTFEDPEYVDVFLNGVRLKKDTDYNLNTANTISSLAALAASDEIEVIVNDVFTLADMVSANNGGDFRGNIAIAKDSGVLSFGLDKEITLTHSADAGLILKHANTADDSFPNLLLQTGDTDIAVNDVLGSIQFQAPDEGTGTDAILVGAAIQAISEGDFSSSSNATKLSFQTGASEAAAEKMSLSSAGVLTVSSNIVSSGTITGGGLLTTGGSIVIPDDGNIGSASDTNAIAISSAGVVTISTNTDATNSTSGALVAHSAGFADDVYVGDGLFVTGAITGSGAVQGTNITATTAFLPDASDGAALGSASLEFSDLFLADGAVINFGADQDINITHVADTGLTTNGSFTASGTMQGTTITATTAFVPDASDGATLGSATLEFADLFLADGGEVKFGADQDVLLRHDHNSGLIIDRTNTSDNSPTTLTLQTAETDIQADDVIGTINFQAPDEGTGTDAILVAAGIDAVSEGDFSSSNNATKLVFKTAASETASSKATLSSTGVFTASSNIITGGTFSGGNVVIPDAGNIGSASDTDAISISSGGVVTFSQAVSGTSADFDGGITVDNITIDGTEIDLSSGDFTLDVAGNIFLNADGGDIRLVDDSTQFGVLQNNSSDFVIQSSVSDKDIVLKGNDDSSGITALTLDMSDAGKALFNAGATFASLVSITTADNSPQLELISTDADANAGPELLLDRNSSSPADDDRVGKLTFKGRNDANQTVEYGNIQSRITDASDGTEDGRIMIQNIINGDVAGVMESNGTETVFNNNSKDLDFRIESDNNANAFFVEGSTGNVGIGNNNPSDFGSLTDNLVIGTTSGENGMTIASGTDSSGRLQFADNTASPFRGAIEYSHGSSDSLLFYTAGSQQLKITNNGFIQSSPTAGNTVSSSANMFITSGGEFAKSTSSRRYKNTINDATHGLTELLKLRSVTYKGNNDGDIVFGGLIAEEVHDVGLTEFVQYDDEDRPDSLHYTHMVALCIKAIQELKAENTALTNRIKTLEDA